MRCEGLVEVDMLCVLRAVGGGVPGVPSGPCPEGAPGRAERKAVWRVLPGGTAR